MPIVAKHNLALKILAVDAKSCMCYWCFSIKVDSVTTE